MRAGDFVCLAYGSGNRDERQYPDPDRYDITRKPRGHLGFGGGVHACLGTAIARLSVKIAFDEFHKVVPNYTPRGRSQLPWMPSSTFRSPATFLLEPDAGRPHHMATTFIEASGTAWTASASASAAAHAPAPPATATWTEDFLAKDLLPASDTELAMLDNVASRASPQQPPGLPDQGQRRPGRHGRAPT
jgi:hypothetical protein